MFVLNRAGVNSESIVDVDELFGRVVCDLDVGADNYEEESEANWDEKFE